MWAICNFCHFGMKIFSSFVTSKVKSHHPVIQGSSLNNSVCCFFPHIQWIIINIRNNAHQDVVHFLSFLCLNNCSSSEQSESLELEEKGQEWARVKQWNVGRVSEAEWKKSSVRPSQRWQLICCVLLFFLSLFFSPPRFPFPLSSVLLRARESDIHPSLRRLSWYSPAIWRAQKSHCAAVSANQRGVLGRDYLEWPCID